MNFIFALLKKCQTNIKLIIISVLLIIILLAVTWLHDLIKDPVSLFTALLVGFTALMWWSTRELVKNTKKSSDKQLRAYLAITDGVILVDHEKNFCCIKVSVRNCGQTPAYSVSNSVIAEVRSLPRLIKQYDPVKPIIERDTSAIVGPGTTINIAHRIQLKSDDLASIKNGSSAIFFWGEVNYVDAFGKNRYLKFRCINSQIVDQSGLHLQPMNEGNEAN